MLPLARVQYNSLISRKDLGGELISIDLVVRGRALSAMTFELFERRAIKENLRADTSAHHKDYIRAKQITVVYLDAFFFVRATYALAQSLYTINNAVYTIQIKISASKHNIVSDYISHINKKKITTARQQTRTTNLLYWDGYYYYHRRRDVRECCVYGYARCFVRALFMLSGDST